MSLMRIEDFGRGMTRSHAFGTGDMGKAEASARIPFRVAFLLTLLVVFGGIGLSQTPSITENPVVAKRGLASRGEALFTGKVRLRNGGPACISCHSVAGIPFPNGGTLGPNLTNAYKKLGPQGIQPAMRTLYFNVMTPIYDRHPLTPEEQTDLIAFFQEAASAPPAREDTQILVGISLAGCVVFLVIIHAVWQDRLKSVRRALVQRARRQEKAS
jgi:mono/diheme cytochrome c family protein